MYSQRVSSWTGLHPELRRGVASEEEELVGPPDNLNFFCLFSYMKTKTVQFGKISRFVQFGTINIWVFHLYHSQYFLYV